MMTSAQIARRSHAVSVAVVLTDADGVTSVLPVESLRVRSDRTAAIRRQCEASLADVELMPASIADPLAPNGAEFAVSRTYTDEVTGATATDPMGVFVVRRDSITFRGGGVELVGLDRGARLQRSNWRQPYAIAAGTLVEDAIADIVAQQTPGIQVVATATGTTLPAMVVGMSSSDDPLTVVRRLATVGASEAFFDAAGRLVVQPIPDPATQPAVATLRTSVGAVDNLLSGGNRTLDGADTYSGVIVQGEDAGVVGEAWDTDPSSPTYAGGSPGDPGFGASAFGAVPFYYRSPLVRTVEQARAVAASLLLEVTGGVETVTVEAVPFGLVVGQVVDVQDSRSRTAGNYLTETIDMPGRPSDGAMQVGLRRRRQ